MIFDESEFARSETEPPSEDEGLTDEEIAAIMEAASEYAVIINS